MALVPFPTQNRNDENLPEKGFSPFEEPEQPGEGRMTFLEHLDELRKRITHAVGGLLFGFIIAFAFINRVFDFVYQRLVSTVPGGQFEPQSGTSMAAPHVTGLVALLFAHHPVLRAQFPKRDANRVRAAFSILQSLCKTSYAHFGAERTGAGLPSLEAVIGTLVQAAQQQPQVGFAQPSFIPQASLSPQGVLTPQGVTPSAIGAATPSTVATELVNQIAQLIGGAVSQAITAAIRSTPVPPVVDDRVGLANSPSPARSRR